MPVTMSMDEAIAKMQETGDWDFDETTRWSDADIADYERNTGLKIPGQLRAVLKSFGSNGFGRPDRHANFIATSQDNSRSVHEVQVLVADKAEFAAMYSMFIGNSAWPGQFTLPMVFFGTADGGHSHLLMDGKAEENSAVYLWERASDPYGTGNNSRGVAHVADSLYEFFSNLKPRQAL